jgi:hypothetical protein
MNLGSDSSVWGMIEVIKMFDTGDKNEKVSFIIERQL